MSFNDNVSLTSAYVRLRGNAPEFVPTQHRYQHLPAQVGTEHQVLLLMQPPEVAAHSNISSDLQNPSSVTPIHASRALTVTEPNSTHHFQSADELYPVEQYHGPAERTAIRQYFNSFNFKPSVLAIEEIRLGQPAAVLPPQAIRYHSHSTKSSTLFFNPSRSNYRGEMNIDEMWIPERMNCKVFVTGIPAVASRKDIFAAINEGKIVSLSYNPPLRGKFSTAAASITFATRESSDKFMARAQSDGQGVFIRGKRVKAVRNRSKAAPQDEIDEIQTRIIQIYGPPGLIKLGTIVYVLRKFIKFELVNGFETIIEDGRRKTVTLEFESIIGQSRAAVKCLLALAEEEGVGGKIKIQYLADPCDPNGKIPSLVY
ncbi:hypothetical protein B0O99DRAFT_685024 [Bisporella sp. PMI_857]|nr:hypothetical protein B0O99DRAFT_685024 [Bisporella sp. PMI_857]